MLAQGWDIAKIQEEINKKGRWRDGRSEEKPSPQTPPSTPRNQNPQQQDAKRPRNQSIRSNASDNASTSAGSSQGHGCRWSGPDIPVFADAGTEGSCGAMRRLGSDLSSGLEKMEPTPFALHEEWSMRVGKRGIRRVTKHTEDSWVQGGFLVDSGSDAHMVPKGMFDAPITPRSGGPRIKFELANGKIIESEGTQTLLCRTQEGYVFRIQCHVAPVDRPIISSGLLLNKGVATVLTDKEQCLEAPGNVKLGLRMIKQTFVLDVKASSFARQQ